MTDSGESLVDFVRKGPARRRWVEQQVASGVCPGCGGPIAHESNRDCFPVITTFWCGTKRRHIPAPEQAETEESTDG